MHDLAWLLSPFETARFFDHIWQQRPAMVATGRPTHFRALFSKAAVERILEFAQPQAPAVRVASAASQEKVEVPLSPNGRINVDQLRKLYLGGHTVILNSVEDFDPAVSQLARAIETEMGARVQVNAYLTPASAQGFKAHYDTHDVLVAQVEGEKRWRIYGGESVCPLNELVDGDPRVRDLADPQIEMCLRPGDLFYIPRGWVHEAATDATASLHLTFGLHPPLAKDLLQASLDALVARRPELREALPVGPLSSAERRPLLQQHFARLVEMFAADALVSDAVETIDDQLLRRGRTGGDGHLFEDPDRLDQLAGQSRLQRRSNLPCRVLQADNELGLQFVNSLIKGPAEFGPALRFVAQSIEPFSVADLPGLSPDLQIALATALIADGICRMHVDEVASSAEFSPGRMPGLQPERVTAA